MKHLLQINILGAVQGVGFRPFIFRLAEELQLNGFVSNTTSGIRIEAEGEKCNLENFILRINQEKPNLAVINSFEFSFHDNKGYTNFEISGSVSEENISVLILPDIAVCNMCLEEMFDSSNRRYLYPFINCINCGPRFSIIESLPYDRQNTSMKYFEMCAECKSEYDNPKDRRFHAQPIACPKCGPHIELWDENGKLISSDNKAITAASELIKRGKIIALKGLGGFQLIADACNDEVVNLLRKRKRRDEKPFAIMFPNIESVKETALVSDLEEMILYSPESPIVLVKKYFTSRLQSKLRNLQFKISSNTAPGNPYLGVMLPYTPLHHLLMKEIGLPVIATSGNISEEPMCIDEYEAVDRLRGIADYFLVHNRPIVRYIDDSITRVVLNQKMILRRARGYAPLPIVLNQANKKNTKCILAVGSHLKNSIAMNIGNNIFISQHIGDLSNKEAVKGFSNIIQDFEKLYHVKPEYITSDTHPEYFSTQFAKERASDLIPVQHHIAHIVSCRLENQVEGKALGVAWDGTGYGKDGTIWGSEFFLSEEALFQHAAQFRSFPLPGGESAIKDTRRSALGLLFEIFGKLFIKKNLKFFKLFSEEELKIFHGMLISNINCPKTTSAGRLFDAVSALTGVSLNSSYEGQSAMMLEFTADQSIEQTYNFQIEKQDIYKIDWQPTIENILFDIDNGLSPSIISAKFHNTLAKIILVTAQIFGEKKVILSGGCFQNIFLLEKTITMLKSNNFKVYYHQRVPTNDGGISLGQIGYAINQLIK